MIDILREKLTGRKFDDGGRRIISGEFLVPFWVSAPRRKVIGQAKIFFTAADNEGEPAQRFIY